MARGDERDIATTNAKRPIFGLRFLALCALILVVIGGIIGLSMSLPSSEATGTTAQSPLPVLPAGVNTLDLTSTLDNPQPWQYDPVTDRHWDASPGHQHWHPGPPPTLNPDPWEYNQETNKHYDPRPGHQHWHDGPPPPPDQRN